MDRARVAQRSLLATLEITAAASLAHVIAGGHLPDAGFLFAFAGVVFLGCLGTLGRVLRVEVVVPIVLLAQVGLHAGLDTASAHAGMHAPAEPTTLLNLTPAMCWAHLITTVVTAIVLLLQERALRVLVGWWRATVSVSVAVPDPRRRRPVDVRPVLRGADLVRISPRRGPPYALPATH